MGWSALRANLQSGHSAAFVVVAFVRSAADWMYVCMDGLFSYGTSRLASALRR